MIIIQQKVFFRLSSLLLLLCLSLGSAQAQVVSNFTGDIDGTEPTSLATVFSCSDVTRAYYFYESFEVTVSQTGSYAFTDLSIGSDLDMYLMIYSPPPFDPTDVLANCIDDLNANGESVNLTAGDRYVFVVQPNISGETGNWEFQLVGPGQVVRAITAPSPVGIPTLSTWAMALLALMLLGSAFLQGYVQRR